VLRIEKERSEALYPSMTTGIQGTVMISTHHQVVRKAVFLAALAGLVAGASPQVHAQNVRVAVAMDPADENSALLPIAVTNTPLARMYTGQVTVLPMRDLRDAMRATRAQENDAMVAPSHVVAAALSNGYELVAANPGETRYVLVASGTVRDMGDLKGRNAYFPNEDSLPSYIGRGLLAQSGLSVGSLKGMSYQQSSLGGLMSLGGRFDVTIASENEWSKWSAADPGNARRAQVLAMSQPLPAGFGVVVRKDAPAAFKKAVVQWVTTTDFVVPGASRFKQTSDSRPYEYLASLASAAPAPTQGNKVAVTAVATNPAPTTR
jgi:hypothetical protein